MPTQLGDTLFLSLMIRHEHAISRLYRALAERLPDSANFWRHLSREEMTHGKLLCELKEEVKLGNAQLASDRFPAKVIMTSLASLEPRTRSWTMFGVAAPDAFSYAYMLETSFIERDFFVPLEGDSSCTVQVLDDLREYTEDHVDRLCEATQKYCPRSWYQRFMDYLHN
jgi:hypothetical protein